MSRQINILYWYGGYGLQKDSEVIADILAAAGFRVTITPYSKEKSKRIRHLPSSRRRLFNQFLRFKNFCSDRLQHGWQKTITINLFLEELEPEWFQEADVNCLIPNQEWFSPEWVSMLPLVDLVLCKTRHAEQTFQKLGCATEFISFTSDDRYLANVPSELTCLHLAGRSSYKGTDVLTAVWSQHPEWPTLKVVARLNELKKRFLPATADNIVYLDQYVEDDQLKYYQNACPIHLCPSKSEGFGHTIVESMSCAALVITTNAPPMNELVSEHRGVLVEYSDAQPMKLGTAYTVDPSSLETKISEALALDPLTRQKLGQNARVWYQENDQFFRQQLVEVLRTV